MQIKNRKRKENEHFHTQLYHTDGEDHLTIRSSHERQIKENHSDM